MGAPEREDRENAPQEEDGIDRTGAGDLGKPEAAQGDTEQRDADQPFGRHLVSEQTAGDIADDVGDAEHGIEVVQLGLGEVEHF